MKIAIFTWLFLLPVQMFAGSYNSRSTEENLERVIIESESKEIKKADLMRNDDINSQSENFQAIIVSLESDVKEQKSKLAHNN